MKFEQLLKDLGYSSLVILVVYIFAITLRELWSIYKTRKTREAQEAMSSILRELDDKLRLLYLPLRERFLVSKHIYESTQNFGKEYSEEDKYIQAEKKGALRNIFVKKVFMPINKEIKEIILNNFYLKDEQDETNYEEILHHYIVWQALEDAKNEELIENYSASELLRFPALEVEKCIAMCNDLINRRKELRKDMLSLGSVSSKSIKTKKEEAK